MTLQQENTLGEALRLAYEEPAHRPAFYRLLLEASVFVRGQRPENDPSDGKVQVMRWPGQNGMMFVPFFSSPDELERTFDTEVAFLEMSGRALFTICGGDTVFVLNPGSPYAREFFPGDIAHLLQHGGASLPEERTVAADTQVLLGQPADYPQRLVDSLSVLLAGHDKVKAAYLTLMHDPSQGPKPSLVVGIEADGADMSRLASEAGVVIAEHGPQGEPVDLMQIHRGEQGLSDYFVREVKPFYERKRGGLLKSLLGFGR